MTTTEYAQFVLQAKQEAAESPTIDEAAAVEAAHLISGSFRGHTDGFAYLKMIGAI